MDDIYCSKCGEKNSISEDYCIECGSILRKLDKYESGDRITSFEDMFTQKHKEQLNETPLTNEIYELILDNIYETGKKSLKNKGSTALEKVADVVEAYAKWSYKSKGGELGFYSANNIKRTEYAYTKSRLFDFRHTAPPAIKIISEIEITAIKRNETSIAVIIELTPSAHFISPVSCDMPNRSLNDAASENASL